EVLLRTRLLRHTPNHGASFCEASYTAEARSSVPSQRPTTASRCGFDHGFLCRWFHLIELRPSAANFRRGKANLRTNGVPSRDARRDMPWRFALRECAA